MTNGKCQAMFGGEVGVGGACQSPSLLLDNPPTRSSMILTFCCVLISDTCEIIGGVFAIRMLSDNTVRLLLKEIKQDCRPDIPDDITADRLVP